MNTTLALQAPGGDVAVTRGHWPEVKEWGLAGMIVEGVVTVVGVIVAASITTPSGTGNAVDNPAPGIGVGAAGLAILAAGIVGFVLPQNELDVKLTPFKE